MPGLTSSTVLERKPKNIAVHTNPEHSLHITDSDIPKPGPDDCLIHVRATGICGSDVHFWKHGRIGDMVVCGENGLGHESAGSVIAVGSNVTNFQPGNLHLRATLERRMLTARKVIVLHLNVVYRVLSLRVTSVAPANITPAHRSSSLAHLPITEPCAGITYILQHGSIDCLTT